MEVIVMVGIAGSGKTTLATLVFPSHRRISLDEIRHDRRREDEMVEESLRQGENIIIDDTNLERKIRARHICLARRHGAQVKAVFMNLPMQKIQENNKNRKKSSPDGALFKMKKQLKPPTMQEGFDFIQEIRTGIPDCRQFLSINPYSRSSPIAK